MSDKQILRFKPAPRLEHVGDKHSKRYRIANIALNDAMILLYDANLGRMEFSERTARWPRRRGRWRTDMHNSRADSTRGTNQRRHLKLCLPIGTMAANLEETETSVRRRLLGNSSDKSVLACINGRAGDKEQ